jgi:hypothetical protein
MPECGFFFHFQPRRFGTSKVSAYSVYEVQESLDTMHEVTRIVKQK